MPSVTNLAKIAVLNAKINQVKSKIPNTTNLATNTVLIDVENKIPDHSTYLTTPEFNKLTAQVCTTRLKQANLTTIGDIADFVKKISMINFFII